MTAQDRCEHELWLRRAVLDGDEQAWRTIYHEAFAPLDRFVRSKCGERRDWVDEVVQETWLIAVRRIQDFDPRRASFEQWLRGIAYNVLRNLARKHGRETDLEPDVFELVASPPGADDWLTRPEVTVVLARLPERQSAVLRAKYLDGRSVNEIAHQWRETPKAIESLLTRARAAFRDLYACATHETE